MLQLENRITRVFKERKKPIFIPYITCGDPSLEVTKGLILRLASIGCDIIELGIPFSDPIADGPIIQEASNRALRQGVTLSKAISLVKEIRKSSSVPIVFLSYYNVIYRYGLSNFAKDAKESEIDGLIVPDLPPEEGKELRNLLLKKDISLIYLVAPTSAKERIKMIDEQSHGFIYYVSLLGVTGIREKLSETLKDEIKALKRLCKKPICVGFGISSPSHAKEVSNADGIIMGSKIVSIISKNQKAPYDKVIPFVSKILKAIKK